MNDEKENSEIVPIVGDYQFENELITVYGSYEEPWFRADEVGKILGLKNTHSSLALIDPDFKGIQPVETLGGRQKVSFVNEYGLYSLIFNSTKPNAIAFKKWVFKEVLPSIRRSGRYEMEAQFIQQKTLIENEKATLLLELAHRPQMRTRGQGILLMDRLSQLRLLREIDANNKEALERLDKSLRCEECGHKNFVIQLRNGYKVRGYEMIALGKKLSKAYRERYNQCVPLRKGSKNNYYTEEEYIECLDAIILEFAENPERENFDEYAE